MIYIVLIVVLVSLMIFNYAATRVVVNKTLELVGGKDAKPTVEESIAAVEKYDTTPAGSAWITAMYASKWLLRFFCLGVIILVIFT